MNQVHRYVADAAGKLCGDNLPTCSVKNGEVLACDTAEQGGGQNEGLIGIPVAVVGRAIECSEPVYANARACFGRTDKRALLDDYTRFHWVTAT
jgi:hypothetical protein